MSRTPLALASLSLLMLGCVTEDNFSEKFASVTCRKMRRCEPDDYDDFYDELGDCVDDAEALWDLVQDGSELFCDIDYQLASRCYRALKLATCSDYEDDDWSPESCEDYVVCD